MKDNTLDFVEEIQRTSYNGNNFSGEIHPIKEEEEEEENFTDESLKNEHQQTFNGDIKRTQREPGFQHPDNDSGPSSPSGLFCQIFDG